MDRQACPQLEVFFDYACPYCLRAHEHLIELLPDYPRLEIVWRPCEAHPRPDRYGPHSDLCIQGMFYAVDRGIDIWAYHDRIYKAVFKDRADIENIDILADCVRDLPGAEGLSASLRKREYVKMQQEANRYAYESTGVRVVPSYRMSGRKLDSIEDIGVTKKQLASFIRY